MKHKHFYAHLLETTDITLELGEMNLTPEERVHLLSLAQANIHTVVVDTVLSSLSEKDKKIFLKNLVSNDHEIIWSHLKKAENIEEKIKLAVKKAKNELLKDIEQVKKIKK